MSEEQILEQELYDDFMNNGSNEEETKTELEEKKVEEPKPEEITDDLVDQEIAFFEFIHDKKTGNVTMNKETFEKLISKMV